ncbi:unnamed protein product [Blepharisma stoltei]|uniref:Kelch motif family protein n=1 Tax=Blepharisma stoltei TaxID=1481888 RepID=A0AAU9KFX9_9CILI|nr:unnamed protein product [Blepharisma stoltei]
MCSNRGFLRPNYKNSSPSYKQYYILDERAKARISDPPKESNIFRSHLNGTSNLYSSSPPNRYQKIYRNPYPKEFYENNSPLQTNRPIYFSGMASPVRYNETTKSATKLPEIKTVTKESYYLHNVKSLENLSPRKPGYAIDSVFEIYPVGNSYKMAYGNPIGMGFLITKHLIMTSNLVFPDDEVASRCFARFTDNLFETHHFDPKAYFYTNRESNFTICGFMLNPESLKQRLPIDIVQPFILSEGDGIAYLNSGSDIRTVIGVDSNNFTYSAGINILPGMPIFTIDWKLQGIHHTQTHFYRFCQASRIDSTLKTLSSIKYATSHPELMTVMSEYSEKIAGLHKNTYGSYEIGKCLYWIDWYKTNIYRYDIALNKWSYIKIHNLNDFFTVETPSWTFNWGSRIAYTPDGCFYIIGGVGKELSDTKADLYHFNTDTREITRKSSMLEKREGPAAVYRQEFIYVMGGKFSYNTCEKYSISENRWYHFAPMIHGRFEPVAALMHCEEYLYVIGGYPQDMVGTTLERFCFEKDNWEAIEILFPLPMINPAIFPVSVNKLALFGGRFSQSIYIFELCENEMDNHTTHVKDEVYKIYTIESFPEGFESVYPVFLYKEENEVFMIKSRHGEQPQIMYYSYLNLSKPPIGRILEHRRIVKLPQVKIQQIL